MINKDSFFKYKKVKKEQKCSKKRLITGEEVIFIFEKVLEGLKTIMIYNTMIQNNPNSKIDKKTTESVATGNCKVSQNELSLDRYEYYLKLREEVYEYRKKCKELKC